MKQKLYFFLPTAVLFGSVFHIIRMDLGGQNSCVTKRNLEFSDSVLVDQ